MAVRDFFFATERLVIPFAFITILANRDKLDDGEEHTSCFMQESV